MFMDLVNDINNDSDILKRLIILNKYIGKEDYFKTIYSKLKQIKKDTYYDSIVYNAKLLEDIDISLNKDREKAIIFNDEKGTNYEEKLVEGIKKLIDFVYSSEELISCNMASIKMFHKTLMSSVNYREAGKFRVENYEVVTVNKEDKNVMDVQKTVSPNFIEMYLYKLVTEYQSTSGSDVIKSFLFMADFLTIFPFKTASFTVCMSFIKTFMLNQGIELLSYFSIEKYIYENYDKYLVAIDSKNKGFTEKKYTLALIKPLLTFGINALIDGYMELESNVDKNENTKYNKKDDVVSVIMRFEDMFKMTDIVENIDIIINKQTINRILKTLLEDGVIEKHGDRKSTKYKVIR